MRKIQRPILYPLSYSRNSTFQEIIETFARRLHNPADFEFQECLRNIRRIAELRLNDKFAREPAQGNDARPRSTRKTCSKVRVGGTFLSETSAPR